jgi:hypothetical protein
MKTHTTEKITVRKLKEILAEFPDEAAVRIEDHYIGYGLNATVFKQILAKNIRGFIDTKTETSLVFCSDYIVNKIEASEKLRLITQEQEDEAPFEMKSMML